MRMCNNKFICKSREHTFQGTVPKDQKSVIEMVDLIFYGNNPKEKI